MQGYHRRVTPVLAPETELVVCCARLDPDVARVEVLVGQDLAWDRVIGEATAQATLPLLYRNLALICSEAVPAARLAELRDHYDTNAARMRTLIRRLVMILGELSRHDIPAIPIKGPVLADSAYGDAALRQAGDLDIVVSPHCYRRASAALLAAGFQAVKQLGWQASFFDPDERVVVDLHRAVTEPRYPVRLGFDELWSGRETAIVEGHALPNLCPDDTLLMLCIQLVKDGWDRRLQLARLADVAQVQRAWPEIDSAELVERARRLGVRRMLHLGLLLTHDVLAAPPPLATVVARSDLPVVPRLAARVRHDLLFRPALPSPRDRGQHRFHFQVRERVRDKVFPYLYLPYYWHVYVRPVVTPSERDRAMVSLPRALSVLYWVIRPFRVVYDHFRRQPESGGGLCRAPDLRLKVVDDRAVLTDDVGRDLVAFDALGALVWQLLDEYGKPSSLAEHLLPRFEDVERSQLEQDIDAFLLNMEQLGLVCRLS